MLNPTTEIRLVQAVDALESIAQSLNEINKKLPDIQRSYKALDPNSNEWPKLLDIYYSANDRDDFNEAIAKLEDVQGLGIISRETKIESDPGDLVPKRVALRHVIVSSEAVLIEIENIGFKIQGVLS